MTNYERIKVMSVEEMVKIICSVCLNCPVKSCSLHNYGSYGCHIEMKNWLESEVTDEA